MKLLSLQVCNIRNIREAELAADPALTVITGRNGQGKTNLLESIWLLTGAKSFRGAKDAELVRRGEVFGVIRGTVSDDSRDNEIRLTVGGPESEKRGRYASVNGVDYGRATAIAGTFTAVVFEPGHLGLIKNGPEGRRRFLDAALCQLYPGYIGTVRRFTRALKQKNALLKHYYKIPDAVSLLDVFDAELSVSGEEITRRRKEYLSLAGPAAERFYAELSSGAEVCRVSFQPCCEPGGLAGLLRQHRETDIKAGHSVAGPQREDFEVLLDETSARIYGSQGQQRSTALCLKLAEAVTAFEVTGQHPVLLLDDVLSELDEGRQAYLLERMQGRQSFVTTCDASAFKRTGGLLLKVSEGRVEPFQEQQ